MTIENFLMSTALSMMPMWQREMNYWEDFVLHLLGSWGFSLQETLKVWLCQLEESICYTCTNTHKHTHTNETSTKRMLSIVYFVHEQIRNLSQDYRSSPSKDVILGLGSGQAWSLWIEKKCNQLCLWKPVPSSIGLSVIWNTDWIMTVPLLINL